MAADEEEKSADEETLPDTALHAYRDDREEDVEGDVDKLQSSDPETSQRAEVSEGEESASFPEQEKH
jgi:hypothetical protein